MSVFTQQKVGAFKVSVLLLLFERFKKTFLSYPHLNYVSHKWLKHKKGQDERNITIDRIKARSRTDKMTMVWFLRMCLGDVVGDDKNLKNCGF